MRKRIHLQSLADRLRDNSSGKGIALAILYIVLAVLPLYAQDTPAWAEPEPLHMWESENTPNFPSVVADPFGRLHAVTVRNYADGRFSGTVYYSRLDDGRWSVPVDILQAPTNNNSNVERLVADQDGCLFLLWSELNNGLLWSQTNSLDAASATAWNSRLLIPNAISGDFVMDGDRVDLVFADRDGKLSFVGSIDGGKTWSAEKIIWDPPGNDQASSLLRLVKGEDDVLHVVWTEMDRRLSWNPSGVWYARSLDGGDTWTDQLYINDEGSYINIGFDALGNVHLLWNHNVGEEDGRYHSMSIDGGNSWSEPEWILPGLSGRTGYPQLVLDSAGSLHQFTSGRGNDLEGGVYHSRWLDYRWEKPTLISKPVAEDNNEGPTVAITSGNLIHVVWRNVFQIHDLLYSHARADAPEEASVPLPGSVLTAPDTSTRTVAQSPRLAPAETVPSATNEQFSRERPAAVSSFTPLRFAILAAGFVVAAIILMNWHKIRG